LYRAADKCQNETDLAFASHETSLSSASKKIIPILAGNLTLGSMLLLISFMLGFFTQFLSGIKHVAGISSPVCRATRLQRWAVFDEIFGGAQKLI
jgi:hypothetical protein